jgi:hypothetical protein
VGSEANRTSKDFRKNRKIGGKKDKKVVKMTPPPSGEDGDS